MTSYSRREFMGYVPALVGLAFMPLEAVAQEKKPWLVPKYKWNDDTLESMVRCSDAYRKQAPRPLPDPLTILYPGSGIDTNVLEIGVQILHDTPIQQIRYIFTEIGEYENLDFAKDNHRHSGNT